MELLYKHDKRHHVEYHNSLNANVWKGYNLEVPGLTPAWASLEYFISSIFRFPMRRCKNGKAFWI